jgi:hypothetical protein
VEGAHGNGEIGESSWTVLWTRPWAIGFEYNIRYAQVVVATHAIATRSLINRV